MTTKHWLICGAWLAAALMAGPATAEDTGTVKDEKLNVRGQPSVFSEVITQLHKGESVTILEEIKHAKPKPGDEARWFRIAMPVNTPVWVSALFVSNNVVMPKTLNVRSGPGENFSVIGRVDKGAELKSIRTVGEWMEIVAPTNTYAFVAAPYLDREAKAPVEKPEVKPAEEKKPEPKKPEPITIVETVKPEPAVVTEAPAKPAPPKVETQVAEAKPATKPAPAAPKPADVEIAPVPPAPKTPPPTAPAVVEDAAPAPPRVVTREGVVRHTISIQAPSPYRLAEEGSGQTINYLYVGNTGLQLKYYVGKRIRISGEEALDKRWPNTPLITIQTLQPLQQ